MALHFPMAMGLDKGHEVTRKVSKLRQQTARDMIRDV